VEEFTLANRKPDGTFDKGKAMPPPFNLTENVGSATLTIDNRRMFLTICDFDADGYKNCDIFMSEQTDGEWQKPKNVGTGVNGKKSFEGQPTVTPDGKTLYFVSIREDEIGTINDMDLYMSRLGANGEWGPARNLGRTINTKGNEKSPFIHEDSHTLYFSSDGHPGIGKFDIYLTRQDSAGKWVAPKNIGYPINTEHDDVGFFVSVDGHTAFLSSNERSGVGGWDLFSFPLYKEARPEKVMFVRGELKDDNNQPVTEARIELKNVRTQEVQQFEVNHAEGKFIAVMNMNDDVVMTVKKDGAAFNARYISKADTATLKTAKLEMTVKEQAKGSVHRLDNINFGTNSADLARESEHILREFAAYLKANPQLKVAIHGHTDNVGDDRANLLLSENRAEAVNQFLVRQGIEGARLSYLGLGESKPVTTNDTPAGRALNRRTEFVIQ
jgi:outer membrane protein OmpA-like peptidoglycan-associated protein